MRKFATTAVLLLYLAAPVVGAQSPPPQVLNCTALLSYRLLHQRTFKLLKHAGLSDVFARNLELKLRVTNGADFSGSFLELLDENLRRIGSRTEPYLVDLMYSYVQKDMILLNEELPAIGAKPSVADLHRFKKYLHRSLVHQKNLQAFLNADYQNPELIEELFSFVTMTQAAINPTSANEPDPEFKSQTLLDWIDNSDHHVKPAFVHMLQTFLLKVSRQSDGEVYMGVIDTMFKIVFIWDQLYNMRSLYESTPGPHPVAHESLQLLYRFAEVIMAGPETRALINEHLDLFLENHAAALMRAQAMYLGAEPSNPNMLLKLMADFETFSERMPL